MAQPSTCAPCETLAVPVPSWVSKTNVTSYLRCEYAFWLTDSRQLDRVALFSPFEAQLRDAGIDFERDITEIATPIETPPGGEAELFAGDETILQVRNFRNPELRLIGRPDGLVTAYGALQPVEIKAHQLLRRSDRIELAFYWLLLAAARTVHAADPAGWVFLRTRDGSYRRERVDLPPELLAETEELIAAVRRARLEGVQPVWCRCTVCRGVRRPDVVASVWDRRHVSSLRGVGKVIREVLVAAGYERWEDLLEADAQDIATVVNAQRAARLVSVSMVTGWQAHAQAFVSAAPILVTDAEPFPVPEEYIAFDAEYTAVNVWLLGARVVRRGGDLSFWWWASPEGEAQAVSDFEAFLDNFAGLPVVTWNGANADIPALRKAAGRAGITDLADRVTDRHVDLFAWTRRNLLLPIPGLSLNDVGEYFGGSRLSDMSGGLEAEMLWQKYRRTGDQELKADLIGYNSDDLDSLVRAVDGLRACATGRSYDAAEPLHEVIEGLVTEREPGGPPIFKADAVPARRSRRDGLPMPRRLEPTTSPTVDRA